MPSAQRGSAPGDPEIAKINQDLRRYVTTTPGAVTVEGGYAASGNHERRT